MLFLIATVDLSLLLLRPWGSTSEEGELKHAKIRHCMLMCSQLIIIIIIIILSVAACYFCRVSLPTAIQKYTVLRSPFIYKKHRVQYEIRTHSRLMQVCR